MTRNLLGNFAGRGIGAVLSLFLVPVYVRFLGVEAYGLVAFFMVLQTFFGFLDLGLSTTTNREIARRVAGDRRGEARDLLRTVESIYWPIGIVIGTIVTIAAPLLARRWLQSETLGVGTMQTAITLMGLTIALQWPVSIYENALHGLQRIVEFNAISAGMQIVRTFGAVLVIWMWPSLTAFFVWQAVVGGVTTVLFFINTWRYMPEGDGPRVKMHLLVDVWRFAAGMSATAALGVILSYSDRLVLSRLLPLASFGYYGIASMAGNGLLYLMAPISLSMLPRFTELFTKGQHARLVHTYHLSAQLMTTALTPVAFTLALFPREVITLWTREASVAERTGTLVSILVMSTLLYAIMEIPYMMQIAQGRTRLATSTNLVSVVLYIPMLVTLVHWHGATGAAAALLTLYTAKFLIWGHLVHTDFMRDEKRRWYIEDVGRPAIAAAAVAIAARFLIPRGAFGAWFAGLPLLAIIVTVSAGAAIVSAPLVRVRAFHGASLLRERFGPRKGHSNPETPRSGR